MGTCSAILAGELMNATTALSLRQRPGRAICAFIGLVLFAASGTRAQDYPNRTVTIVAPSAPGGMYSILARLIGSKLERLYGQSFVIENRPGASSITGAVFVTHAAPDGYTLMTAATTTLATNGTGRSLTIRSPISSRSCRWPGHLRFYWSTPRCRCVRSRTWSRWRVPPRADCRSARPDPGPGSISTASSSRCGSASRCNMFPTRASYEGQITI